MLERISKYVIPKWRRYLEAKMDIGGSDNIRRDTIWKKLLRDVREFYRILFRVRFHYLDFKDHQGAYKWIDLMFEELGIEMPKEYKNNSKLFQYIHQSHKTTNQRIFENNFEEDTITPFEVIERFNEISRKLFMSDVMDSRLFYFVFSNFLDVYIKYLSPKYRVRAVTLVCLILRCYNRMTDIDHLKRVCFHLISQ